MRREEGHKDEAQAPRRAPGDGSLCHRDGAGVRRDADSGKAYERFVFEKLQRFFSDGVVALNDRIPGRESGLLREIDVSVRLDCLGLDLLYLFQCKDWVTKADINVLGELAAVMSDVGAAKGFLLCSAGFRKSNHKYAATKGIELITIEDVRSERWHVTVQVPLVYIRKLTHYQLEV